MDILGTILDWASTPETSNAARTFVALLAIPGGLWGFWLFGRWISGRGLDRRVEQLLEQNGGLSARVDQLLAQNSELASQNRGLTNTVERLATQVARQFVGGKAPAASTASGTPKSEAQSFGRAVAQLAHRTDAMSQKILALLSSGQIAEAHREFSEIIDQKEKGGETLNEEDVRIARSIATVMRRTNMAEASKLFGKAAGAGDDLGSWIEAGDSAREAGREDDALQAYERARVLAEENNDDAGLARACDEIADILHARQQLEKSVQNKQLAFAAQRRADALLVGDELLSALQSLHEKVLQFVVRIFSDDQYRPFRQSAVKHAELNVKVAEEIAAIDPTNLTSQEFLAIAYQWLVTALKEAGDFDRTVIELQKQRDWLIRLREQFPSSSRLSHQLKQTSDEIERLAKRLAGAVADRANA